jgi:ABC-type multidrug transport system ATPase subunit
VFPAVRCGASRSRARCWPTSILVLDEPTEGLDARTTAQPYEALAAAMSGRSVLLITHRLGGLTKLVDEVALIAAGTHRRMRPGRGVSGSAACTGTSRRADDGGIDARPQNTMERQQGNAVGSRNIQWPAHAGCMAIHSAISGHTSCRFRAH